MSRAALYAYEPHEVQDGTSLEEQLRNFGRHVEQVGWTVAGRYHDAAIAGDSLILRPGLQSLLIDARAGAFDVVVTESLGRLARDEADFHELFKRLRSARVRIVTLAEAELEELHVGLEDLAAKTHCGLRRRVEAGRSGGGLGYGYDIVKTVDAAGERVRGNRRINEVRFEAEVVRRGVPGVRIRCESAYNCAGDSMTEAFPAPPARAGPIPPSAVKSSAEPVSSTTSSTSDAWCGTACVSSRTRKPEGRVSLVNRREDWIVTEVPELCIVDDALWQAVKGSSGKADRETCRRRRRDPGQDVRQRS